jgi:hypothetical protein
MRVVAHACVWRNGHGNTLQFSWLAGLCDHLVCTEELFCWLCSLPAHSSLLNVLRQDKWCRRQSSRGSCRGHGDDAGCNLLACDAEGVCLEIW